MEALLSFFADLLLFTAGAIVSIIWVIVIIGGLIELYDAITGKDKTPLTEDDECDCAAHHFRGRECTCYCVHTEGAV